MTQVVEVHRGLTQTTANGMPVVTLGAAREHPALLTSEDHRVTVHGPRHCEQPRLCGRGEHARARFAVLWKLETAGRGGVLAFDVDLPIRCGAPSLVSSTRSGKTPVSSWTKWVTPIPRSLCASTGRRCDAVRTRRKRSVVSSNPLTIRGRPYLDLMRRWEILDDHIESFTTSTIHRPECRHAPSDINGSRHEAGSILASSRAPRICKVCVPRVLSLPRA